MTKCKHVSCHTIIEDGETYCQAHKGLVAQDKAQMKREFDYLHTHYGTNRIGLYKSAEWKRLSRNFLRLNPFCAKCGNPATTCHHTDYADPYNPDKLVALCRECHDEISLQVFKTGNWRKCKPTG